jgi:hypothetical protein
MAVSAKLVYRPSIHRKGAAATETVKRKLCSPSKAGARGSAVAQPQQVRCDQRAQVNAYSHVLSRDLLMGHIALRRLLLLIIILRKTLETPFAQVWV